MADKQASDKVLWTPEHEVALFHAMQGRKPVGINKHFNMMCIQNRFSLAVGFTVSTDQIWEYLSTLYDIDALDEVEAVPFPMDHHEFSLPEDFKGTKQASAQKEGSEISDKDKPDKEEPPPIPLSSSKGDQVLAAHPLAHRRGARGRRSSTGSVSPIPSPSNSKVVTKRRR